MNGGSIPSRRTNLLYIMAKQRIVVTNTEPKFDKELSQSDLSHTLSWYSQNKDLKESHKYALDFLKKKHKISVEASTIKSRPSTFGFICRIVTNGGILSEKDSKWFDAEIEQIKEETKNVKVVVEDTPKTTVTPNIQDRLRDKASECIGELEGQVDEMIISGFKTIPAPYAVMNTLEIKSVHCRFIKEWAKKNRIFYDIVANTADKETKEAYSNFTKTQLKKFVAYFDQVILDCDKVGDTVKKTKKPRKVKVKTKDQLVSKVKYCAEEPELKLKSISPTEIIGATQLWVYNKKYRKLGVYHAEDAGGFSIKGTMIQGYSESKSIQKTLRKPEVSLPEVMKATKLNLRTFMDDIKTAKSGLTGRINEDTILLRTLK